MRPRMRARQAPGRGRTGDCRGATGSSNRACCAVATISIWRLFAEAFVDRANLRLGGLRLGKKILLAQLSMMAGAMVESLMSASDCVAKMTLTFFF